MKRAIILGLLWTASAAGQCALCYRTAQSLGVARGHVFNAGILVLGTPPLLLLAGFVVFVARRRNAAPEE